MQRGECLALHASGLKFKWNSLEIQPRNMECTLRAVLVVTPLVAGKQFHCVLIHRKKHNNKVATRLNFQSKIFFKEGEISTPVYEP